MADPVVTAAAVTALSRIVLKLLDSNPAMRRRMTPEERDAESTLRDAITHNLVATIPHPAPTSRPAPTGTISAGHGPISAGAAERDV